MDIVGERMGKIMEKNMSKMTFSINQERERSMFKETQKKHLSITVIKWQHLTYQNVLHV